MTVPDELKPQKLFPVACSLFPVPTKRLFQQALSNRVLILAKLLVIFLLSVDKISNCCNCFCEGIKTGIFNKFSVSNFIVP
jgi:hypothetical protein